VGIKAENLATVGDSYNDDCLVPQSVGIAMTFLIDVNHEYAAKQSSTLKPVAGIAEITRFLHSRLDGLPRLSVTHKNGQSTKETTKK